MLLALKAKIIVALLTKSFIKYDGYKNDLDIVRNAGLRQDVCIGKEFMYKEYIYRHKTGTTQKGETDQKHDPKS